MKKLFNNAHILGITQIILSGICFGFLGVFGRMAFKQNVTPQELLGLRFLAASYLLFMMTSIKYGLRVFKINKFKLFHLAVLGLLGYAVFSSFYFIAIQNLSITLAVLLLYTFPIWVTIGAWIFLKEHLSVQQALIIPIAFLGLIFLIGFDFDVLKSSGLIFGLGSAMTYAVYILLSRNWLRDFNPWVAVCYIQFFAGLALFVMSFQSASHTFEVVQKIWPIILGLAFICSVLAMTLFQSGLQKVKSWEASILSTSEPLTGITLATLFFNERLAPLQIFGAALVILSFVLISRLRV